MIMNFAMKESRRILHPKYDVYFKGGQVATCP
jgi:hypothetical protein